MKKLQEQIQDDFLNACTKGDIVLLKNVLPFVDFEDSGLIGLMFASREGFLDIVKEIVPFVKVGQEKSVCLQLAAKYGHAEIVKELLPHSNAKEKRSAAFRFAFLNGHHDVVNILWDVSDVQDVMEWFEETGLQRSLYQEIKSRLQAEKSKNNLKAGLIGPKNKTSKKHLKM